MEVLWHHNIDAVCTFTVLKSLSNKKSILRHTLNLRGLAPSFVQTVWRSVLSMNAGQVI